MLSSIDTSWINQAINCEDTVSGLLIVVTIGREVKIEFLRLIVQCSFWQKKSWPDMFKTKQDFYLQDFCLSSVYRENVKVVSG